MRGSRMKIPVALRRTRLAAHRRDPPCLARRGEGETGDDELSWNSASAYGRAGTLASASIDYDVERHDSRQRGRTFVEIGTPSRTAVLKSFFGEDRSPSGISCLASTCHTATSGRFPQLVHGDRIAWRHHPPAVDRARVFCAGGRLRRSSQRVMTSTRRYFVSGISVTFT